MQRKLIQTKKYCTWLSYYAAGQNGLDKGQWIHLSSLYFVHMFEYAKEFSVAKHWILGKFWDFIVEILSGYLVPMIAVNLGAIKFDILSNWSLMKQRYFSRV